jgi:hypothetical protein
MTQKTKFTYRDFYDVPRMIIVNHRGQKLLLDCKFDDSLDDYPTIYKLYILPNEIDEKSEKSWEAMPARAVKYVGEIPVKCVIFDHTKRAELETSVIDDLLSGPSPPR